MSLLFVMRGKAIKEIETANDYLSIVFDDGSSGINIFNDYTTDVSHLSELIGKIVQDISEGGDHWKLIFNEPIFKSACVIATIMDQSPSSTSLVATFM